MSWVRGVRIFQAGSSGLLADAAQKLTERSWEEVPRWEKLQTLMICSVIRLIPSKACKPGLLRKKKTTIQIRCFMSFYVTPLCSRRIVGQWQLCLNNLREVILCGLLGGVVLFYQLCEVLENLFHPPMLAP